MSWFKSKPAWLVYGLAAASAVWGVLAAYAGVKDGVLVMWRDLCMLWGAIPAQTLWWMVGAVIGVGAAVVQLWLWQLTGKAHPAGMISWSVEGASLKGDTASITVRVRNHSATRPILVSVRGTPAVSTHAWAFAHVRVEGDDAAEIAPQGHIDFQVQARDERARQLAQDQHYATMAWFLNLTTKSGGRSEKLDLHADTQPFANYG
ncbi:MAG: hypothetical protein ABIO70_08760 [Pseudomonadota bacterium]